MKFYLDTADRPEAEALLATGLFSGLTTNPTLLARAGIRHSEIPQTIRWARAAGAGTVFVQAWGTTAGQLRDSGLWIHAQDPETVVKVPATEAGLTATAALVSEGIRVLVTAVYTRSQALPAMAAGADYIAPYLGRMLDAGLDGLAEIAAIQRSIDSSGSPLKVLVASLRTPGQAAALAAAGVTEFTLSPAVWHSFFDVPLTQAAVKQFEADSLD